VDIFLSFPHDINTFIQSDKNHIWLYISFYPQLLPLYYYGYY